MRKSSKGALPTAPQPPAPRLAEMIAFEPTDAQLRARTAFWVRHRADPLVAPQHMTGAELAAQLDMPSFATWWRNPSFRSWFLQKEEWREEAEFALALLLREMTRRLQRGLETTKDLIGVGKLLSEITSKTGRTSESDPANSKVKLSDEDAMRVFRETATALGWTPPAELPATPATPAPADGGAE